MMIMMIVIMMMMIIIIIIIIIIMGISYFKSNLPFSYIKEGRKCMSRD